MSHPATFEARSIRVVHLDDQLLFRVGIRSLICRSDCIQVVGDAGTRAEALTLVHSVQPDVILLDLALKGESGVDLIPDLMTAAAQAKN